MPHVSCLRQSAEFGIKLPSCSLGDLLLQYLVSLLSPVGMLFDILSSLAVESICYACLMIDRRTQDAFQLCRFCVLTAIPAKTEAGGFKKGRSGWGKGFSGLACCEVVQPVSMSSVALGSAGNVSTYCLSC